MTPNDALIAALDGLREAYLARQRAANGALAALKGTATALTKVARSLAEFEAQGQAQDLTGGVDADRLAAARAAVEGARLRDDAIDPLLPDLRRETKRLADLDGALKDALVALRAETVDVVRLGRAVDVLQASQARTPDDALSEILQSLHARLDAAQKALGSTFAAALRDAFATDGIEIRGQPPRFEMGRFELTVDFAGRNGVLRYGKDVVARKVALSVEAVRAAYAREVKAVMGRNEDGDRWIGHLFEAYQTVRARRGQNSPGNERANLVECYVEVVFLRQGKAFRIEPLKSVYKDYTRAQFAYDVFDMAQVRHLAHKGQHATVHVSTKSQTDTPDRSVWIVESDSPYRGRYISDIEFS